MPILTRAGEDAAPGDSPITHEPTPSVAATVGLQRKISAAVAAFASLGAATAAAQQVLYVDDDAPAGGNGQSWQTAFSTVYDALGLLSGSGGSFSFAEVRIAQGRYFVSDPQNGSAGHSLFLQSGMTLAGGFRGLSPGGQPGDRNPSLFATVIDGDAQFHGNPSFNSEVAIQMPPFASVGIDGLRFHSFGRYVIKASYPTLVAVSRCEFTAGVSGMDTVIRGWGGRLWINDCRFVGLNAGDKIVDGSNAVDVVLKRCDFVDTSAGGVVIDASGADRLEVMDCRFVALDADEAIIDGWGADEVILDGCEFEGNTTGSSIVRVAYADRFEVSACRFESNFAGWGAAVFSEECFLFDLTDTIVKSTTAPAPISLAPVETRGGGLLFVDHCTFQDNRTGNQWGGALHVAIDVAAVISHSIFSGNEPALHGGAIYGSSYHFGTISISDSLIVGNRAAERGGGIYAHHEIDIERCTIADNDAGEPAGAGVYLELGTAPSIRNSVLWNNTHAGSLSGVSQAFPSAASAVSDSIITGIAGGLGNLSLNPLFLAPGDYRLSPNSPAINLGFNPAFDPLSDELDLAGNPRVSGGFLDAGCYEATIAPGCGPADLALTAVRGMAGYRIPDGTVGSNDFFVFLEAYTRGDAAADLTTTGIPGAPGYGVPNGLISNEDFFYYLILYEQGC